MCYLTSTRMKRGDFYAPSDEYALMMTCEFRKEKPLIRASKTLKKTMLLMSVAALTVSAPLSARAESAFTPEQKKELEGLFKDYIMNNPQVIMDSVQVYQMKEQERAQKSAEEKLSEYKDKLTQSDLPFTGNPEGDVTVVEFFDFNCGYCKKAFEDVTKVLEEDKNLKVVFIDMPILSDKSEVMAKMAMAAYKQGKYFEAHKALMNFRGTQTEENYLNALKEAGLDVEKIKTDMASPDIDMAIQKHLKIANELNIRGTPGFVIGDQLHPGYIGLDGLKMAIQDARSGQKKQ